jgi:hypothetical protein
MEYIWIIFGTYMDYIWNIYGSYMEYDQSDDRGITEK